MAFWKGAMIGAVAGAVYGIWMAPRSGSASRAGVEEIVEDSLFRLAGMDVWQPVQDRPLPPEWYATVANPDDWKGKASA